MHAVRALLASVGGSAGAEVVRALATATLETSEAALAQTMARARELDETVRNIREQVFDALRKLADERKAAVADFSTPSAKRSRATSTPSR